MTKRNATTNGSRKREARELVIVSLEAYDMGARGVRIVVRVVVKVTLIS